MIAYCLYYGYTNHNTEYLGISRIAFQKNPKIVMLFNNTIITAKCQQELIPIRLNDSSTSINLNIL